MTTNNSFVDIALSGTSTARVSDVDHQLHLDGPLQGLSDKVEGDTFVERIARFIEPNIPSVTERQFTILKTLGDGAFSKVSLCDWRGGVTTSYANDPLRDIMPSGRPVWQGRKLVALKKMRRRFSSWEDFITLNEVQFFSAGLSHPNIVLLHDVFLETETLYPYFVFEAMEGHLYHFIKSRKGKPLAEGLIASVAFQLGSGVNHIHSHGFFHRDLKPENLLILTMGHKQYATVAAAESEDGTLSSPERDVHLRLKLADFGLCRGVGSPGPYTEYVATRWYRAPEVLLLSRSYTSAVDMWAMGVILAEVANQRPLFPGIDQVNQLTCIAEVLGDPVHNYPTGGGRWDAGVALGRQLGFVYHQNTPQALSSKFDSRVLPSLVSLIECLLRWDPSNRLTSHEFLQQPYFQQTRPEAFAYDILEMTEQSIV